LTGRGASSGSSTSSSRSPVSCSAGDSALGGRAVGRPGTGRGLVGGAFSSGGGKVLGSPNPGGSSDSGVSRFWLRAGMATSRDAAPARSRPLLRQDFIRDILLDLLQRLFTVAEAEIDEESEHQSEDKEQKIGDE
jgi:hypothetical protein